MLNVSENFKTAMKQPVKEIQAFINYDNNAITDADDLISFKISCDSGLCKSAMRKLEADFLGNHDLLGKTVQCGFGVRLPDGEFEYLYFGSFLVMEFTTSKDTEISNIVAYDLMVNAMTPYMRLYIEYPIDLLSYTKKLCEACGLELGNNIFGKNICPNSLNNWEMGHYNLSGEKENNGSRCRLKDLIPVKPDTKYYVNTNSSKATYNFVIRGYDQDKNFVISYGACPTGTILNTDNVYYLGVGMYDFANESGSEGQIVLSSIESGETKPFICLDSETDKGYSPYNPMNDWQITATTDADGNVIDLWENIDGITYRDIFVQIAQATGSTCIIHDDKLYFKSLTDTGERLTYDNMFKLKLEALYGEINSVVLSRTPSEDNVYLQDESSIETNGLTEFKIENNEIIDKDRENAIQPIFDALRGISYYPFEATTEGLGWYEIGDSFTIIEVTNDGTEREFKTSLFNYSITVDGSIKETLKTTAETQTQTQYQYATTISKRIKNTEVIVNKQEGYIKQLVSDVEGVNEKYTYLYQDIEKIVANVQNSGGSNLLKNSVMFSHKDNVPSDWELSEGGYIEIQSDADSLSYGCVSGHSFTLKGKTVKQEVVVTPNDENNATSYTFSVRIKKGADGSCYVKIYNDATIVDIVEILENSSEEYKEYKEYTITFKPEYSKYTVELYGSTDSDATFTDCMFALGDYKSQWTQANGEIMNTQVNINIDGVLVKSIQYEGDYTVMSPIEFAGYSNIDGTPTRVFSLNRDVTKVKKLDAEDEIKMYPIKIVPITEGDIQGIAFVPSS